MRPKTLLALVLLLHFLAHPAIHNLTFGLPESASLTEPSEGGSPAAGRESLGSCLNCRTGSNLVAAPLPGFLHALVSLAPQPAASDEFLPTRLMEFPLSSRAPPRR